MKKILIKRVLSFVVLLCMSSVSLAGTYPVDDSTSTVLSPLVRMKWNEIAPIGQSQNNNMMRGQTDVLVRLDTRPFQSKVGRIFMRLDNPSFGRVSATWQTNGVLLPGIVRSGERSLVYSGVITQSVIEDTMRLILEADGRQLEMDQQIKFSFEVDID